MFADRPATVMIPASDVARALRWYSDKLGITPGRSDEHGASFTLNGVDAYLYGSEFAGTAKSTLISFSSPDLVADMAALRRRGVSFIDYDLPGLKTVDGLAEFGPVKNAWAIDSEGNILGFVEGM